MLSSSDLYASIEQPIGSTPDCVHSVFVSLFLALLFQDLQHTNEAKLVEDLLMWGSVMYPYSYLITTGKKELNEFLL